MKYSSTHEIDNIYELSSANKIQAYKCIKNSLNYSTNYLNLKIRFKVTLNSFPRGFKSSESYNISCSFVAIK